MKTCAHCSLLKDASEYYASSPYVCKPCHVARSLKRHKENPWAKREATWKNKYGILDMNQEKYERMYELQEGLCKVCQRPEPVSGRLLAVDHSHTTGEIRGLLCTKCNTTAGWVEQFPYIVQYLFLERK